LRRTYWPETVLFALTVAWGLSFPLIGDAVRKDVGVFHMTFLRMALAVALLLAVRPSAVRATRLEWRAGVLGGICLGAGYVLQTSGMVQATSGASGFLTAFYVCLVPLFEAAVYRRSPPRRDLLALLVATAGIALMVLKADLTLSLGEAAVGASAFFWAAQIVIVGRVAERVDPLRLTVVQLFVAMLVGAVGIPFTDEPPTDFRWEVVGTIAYLGVVTNALAFLALAWAQKRVPPTRTAVLLSAEPVFAALFGIWLAGETYGPCDAAGAALVLAAVVIAVFGRREPAGG
jgi:drug/metabolite transporter (DMT)-like permease